MRSILIEKPGSFEIAEINKPTPAPDEILIEVKSLSLCNQHDWKVNKGLYQNLKYLEYGIPGFPGHEGAGVVVEAGSQVKKFKIGDHVVMSGLAGPPLYSEFVTRKADQVALVDKKIPFDHIAMSELFGCVHRACRKISDYRGKSVAVSGCGPGGLAAIQIVKAYGADRVIAIDIQSHKLEIAALLGADLIADAKNHNSIDELKKSGCDIFIECSGNKLAYRNAIQIAREAVIIFSYAEGNIELPLWNMFDHELTIYNSKWLTNDDLQAAVNFIASGKIKTDTMISAKVDFEHYLDAVEMIGRGEAIKIIMTP
ncbi:MAG: zinc-binding dehydrogenase [bacterium]|nr:zinc-binding dehydrogenase [bacterium]